MVLNHADNDYISDAPGINNVLPTYASTVQLERSEDATFRSNPPNYTAKISNASNTTLGINKPYQQLKLTEKSVPVINTSIDSESSSEFKGFNSSDLQKDIPGTNIPLLSSDFDYKVVVYDLSDTIPAVDT